MKTLLHWSALLVGSLLSLLPLCAAADLKLNGLDTYHHMGKDYYWVAFYTTDSCQSAGECQSANTDQRFRLKVITERWTAQSFNLVWQRELASNNPTLPPKLDMAAVIHFTQLPKTGLTYGDVIDISYDGHDTTIAINQVFALRSPSKSLFNYLSNVWLGPIPPSRSFRANMLMGHNGEHNPQLLTAFSALKPTQERMALLSEWINTSPVTPTPKTTPQKTTASLTEVNSSKANASVTEAKVDTPPAKKSVKTEKSKKQKAASAIPSTEQARAIYQWRLFKTLHENVKYPAWAKQLAQEGVVRIEFELDDHFQLQAIHNIEPTYAGLLADALTDAVKNSDLPKPLWPNILEQAPYDQRFIYEHHFQLREPSVYPPLAPELALFLVEQPAVASKPQLADQATLTQHLTQFIEYPYWAKKMRLKGSVTAEIVLQNHGDIQSAVLIKKSRHPELDAALLDAINKAAPFPTTIHEGETQTFNYEHRFQP